MAWPRPADTCSGPKLEQDPAHRAGPGLFLPGLSARFANSGMPLSLHKVVAKSLQRLGAIMAKTSTHPPVREPTRSRSRRIVPGPVRPGLTVVLAPLFFTRSRQQAHATWG
jgi:hypothetical protein